MDVATRIIPTVQNPDLVTHKVLVDGQEIPKTYHITNITVTTEINKIPTATLTIVDGEPNEEKFEISDKGDFLPGKKIEIQLGYHNENKTIFKGIIITNTHKVNETCAEMQVECKDETVKMTVNRGNRHFNDVTDSDIITRILDENQVNEVNVETLSAKHEQLVQANVSDWDYMISRIDTNAMICVISNGQLAVKKPNMQDEPILELIYGANILEFNADMDARTQTSSVKTLSWDFANQQVVTTESEDSGAPEPGEITRENLAAITGKPLEMRTPAMLSQHDAQAIANAKKLRQDLSKIKARVKYQGVTNAMHGDFVTIKGAGKNFNGKAFVSAIQHEYAEGDWITEATLGWNEQFFAEQTSPHQGAAVTAQTSTMQGLQIGIVTDLEDSNGQYRVRVRLPMVNDQDDGVWARIATLDAGNNRGTFFRPEIDDEVVVGFMNDDPSHPVILGMLHSSAKPAPLEPENANREKGYVSRSQIKLIFNDDKKSVIIETPGSRVIEMDDDAGTITIKDGNSNKIVMDQSGVTIESATEMTIKAGTSLSISAPQISLKADASMSVEGSGSASISSSGITEIKGSLVKIN